MRFWHQSMADLTVQPTYAESLQDHVRAVCGQETEIEVHGLPEGTYAGLTTTDVLRAPYLYHLVYHQIIEYGRQAEDQGFDAFVIASFSEPFVRELRSILDIPVVSIGEACMLVACSLGKKQALISSVPAVQRIVEDHVRLYGLESRVSAVRSVGPMMDELQSKKGWSDPSMIIEEFLRLSRQEIENGADVIIPAEAVLSSLLRCKQIITVDSVPILDTVGIAWNYAEMLVNLWRKTGLRVGRAWEYTRPPESVLRRFAPTLPVSER
jgi:allantoin racemase